MADSLVQLGIAAEPFPQPEVETVDAREKEQALVARLRRAEESAYEELLERFEQPVYNIVYRMLNDPNDANDVVQEVFFKVFRRIQSFRAESSLKTWVYRIAVNEACNRRRYFQRHLRQEVELNAGSDEGWGLEETIPSAVRSPFEEVLNREQLVLLQQALARINPVYRAAVVLRDIEELGYEEIAEILQIALGTVKSRILRGREALRTEYLRVSEEAPPFTLAPQPAE